MGRDTVAQCAPIGCPAWAEFIYSSTTGFVTLPNEECEEAVFTILSGGRDRRPPRVHGRRTESAVRSGGCQVALDVEGIVDGCVSRKKSLG